MWKTYWNLVLSSEVTVWTLVTFDILLLVVIIIDIISKEKNAYISKKNKSVFNMNKFLNYWSRDI